MLTKIFGAGCLVVSLYYLRFFAVRQETFTGVQIVLLLSAGALLVPSPSSTEPVRPTWRLWH